MCENMKHYLDALLSDSVVNQVSQSTDLENSKGNKAVHFSPNSLANKNGCNTQLAASHF